MARPGEPSDSQLHEMVRALHLAEPQLIERELVDRLIEQSGGYLVLYREKLWRMARDLLVSS